MHDLAYRRRSVATAAMLFAVGGGAHAQGIAGGPGPVASPSGEAAAPSPETIGGVQSVASGTTPSAGGGVPNTAAQFAPSRPSLNQTEPTSTVGAETLGKIATPTDDYDDVVNLTPSTMDIAPAGPGLQQDFGQSIRGLQYTQFTTLFDGIPVPGFPFNLAPQPGAYFLSRDFSAITVNRGPGPASAIGNATFGGYVDIRSQIPDRAVGLQPYGTFGSFGTKFFGVEGQSGAIGALGGATGALDLTREEARAAVTGADTERRNLFLKYAQPVGDSTVVTLLVNLDNDDTLTPYGATLQNIDTFGRNFNLNADPTSQNFAGYNRDNYTTDFEYLGIKSFLGDGWSIDNKAFTTAYDQRDRHGSDPGGDATLSGDIVLDGMSRTVADDVPGVENKYDFRDWGDVFRMTKATRWGELRFGIYGDRQGFDTNSVNIDLTQNAEPYVIAGATGSPFTARYFATLVTVQPYGEFAWKPTRTLTVTAGVKYSAVTRTLTGPVGLDGSATDDHASYNKALPSFDANWRVLHDLSVYAQAAEGYLTPELNLFGTTAPTSVQPSTTWSYQIGTVFQRRWLSLGADGYYIDYNNYISSSTVGAITTFANGGGATYKGLEIEGTAGLGRGFAVYANASLNDSNYDGNGNNLAQTPRRTGVAALLYDKGSLFREGDELFASVIGKLVGPQYGVDTNVAGAFDQFPIKSYNEADANLGYVFPALGHRFRASVNATNLLDHRSLTGYDGSTVEGQPLYWVQAGRAIFFSFAAYL